MKAEEKLARELIPYIAGCRWDQASSKERIRAEDTAIYVLRRERAAVRRARGRTIGYIPVVLSHGKLRMVGQPGKPDELDIGNVADSDDGVSRVHRVARVVAVPRKGGRK